LNETVPGPTPLNGAGKFSQSGKLPVTAHWQPGEDVWTFTVAGVPDAGIVSTDGENPVTQLCRPYAVSLAVQTAAAAATMTATRR
jgi:hypothetical protein